MHGFAGVNVGNFYPTFTYTASVNRTNVAGGTPWTKITGYITIPAGYDRFQPYLQTTGSVPAADVGYVDDLMLREVTESQNIIGQLFGGNTVLSSILAGSVPALDASKIQTGAFATGLIPALDTSKITSGVFNLLRLPAFDATQITSGTFPQNMITNLAPNLASIFTTITSPTKSELLQNVPVSAIGQFNPELLTNPTYDSSASVLGGSDWSWDPAVTHTADGTGSVSFIANPTLQQLLSDPPIPVSPGQILTVSHWLRWASITATGPSFTLAVNAYLGAGISNTVILTTITNPATSSGWVQLSGSYTVPASGVDNIGEPHAPYHPPRPLR